MFFIFFLFWATIFFMYFLFYLGNNISSILSTRSSIIIIFKIKIIMMIIKIIIMFINMIIMCIMIIKISGQTGEAFGGSGTLLLLCITKHLLDSSNMSIKIIIIIIALLLLCITKHHLSLNTVLYFCIKNKMV